MKREVWRQSKNKQNISPPYRLFAFLPETEKDINTHTERKEQEKNTVGYHITDKRSSIESQPTIDQLNDKEKRNLPYIDISASKVAHYQKEKSQYQQNNHTQSFTVSTNCLF